MDKVGIGFVAYLGKGATLENITFEGVNVNITECTMDGLGVGVAVGYLDGGTIKNVNVASGTVKSVFYTAGLVGAASSGTITGCTIGTYENNVAKEAVKIITDGNNNKTNDNSANAKDHYVAAGLIGVLRDYTNGVDDAVSGNVVIENTKAYVELEAKCANGDEGYVGKVAGKMWNNIITINSKHLTTDQGKQTDGATPKRGMILTTPVDDIVTIKSK